MRRLLQAFAVNNWPAGAASAWLIETDAEHGRRDQPCGGCSGRPVVDSKSLVIAVEGRRDRGAARPATRQDQNDVQCSERQADQQHRDREEKWSERWQRNDVYLPNARRSIERRVLP